MCSGLAASAQVHLALYARVTRERQRCGCATMTGTAPQPCKTVSYSQGYLRLTRTAQAVHSGSASSAAHGAAFYSGVSKSVQTDNVISCAITNSKRRTADSKCFPSYVSRQSFHKRVHSVNGGLGTGMKAD